PERAKGRSGKPIDAVIKALDHGKLRVCEPVGPDWVTHAWIKTAILLYFRRHRSRRFISRFDLEYPQFFDKIPLTNNYKKLEVRDNQPITIKGRIPSRAVVIPGSIPKDFPAGSFGAPCALIIGTRNDSTDRKTSLESALREYEVAV